MDAKERDRILNEWAAIHERYATVREFIEFAHEKGHRMMYHQRGEIDPQFCFTPVPGLIDEFFGVDQTKLDDARRALLESIRSPDNA